MRDVDDADAEPDGDLDGDADDDGDANSSASPSEASENFNATEQDAPQQTDPAEASSARGMNGDSVPSTTLPVARPEALTALTYDILPTVAAPQSTSINAITATWDMQWVFSGGSDGYIRKYNWVDTINGKLMLTVAQRHPFVDSVVKAGLLMAYWENWDSPPRPGSTSDTALSPVYSLAAQSQGLWLLAGTEGGNIRLQSTRHDEGKEIALLKKHTSAVSVLTLAPDEKTLLSGSWDKSVQEWDLNTGSIRTSYGSNAGQISSIEFRPASSVPVPEETGELPQPNGTFSSNNHMNGRDDVELANGTSSREHSRPPQDALASRSSPDSLFGGDEGDDDLFGDSGGAVMTNGASLPDAFDDEEPLAHGISDSAVPRDRENMEMNDADHGLQPVKPPADTALQPNGSSTAGSPGDNREPASRPIANGLPHGEESETAGHRNANISAGSGPVSDSTFLATSVDGTIRVWDRRQPNPVARIVPRNTPPWCMSACWSPDGNYIFAGRRNCTVEEFDLRKGLKFPDRIFKFPQGSGPVTAVKTMPNGRHLIWFVSIHPSRQEPR